MEESEALETPYNYLPKRLRVLWHQTLNTILKYPELPRRMINFDLYPIFKLQKTNQRTIGGNVVTIHEKFIEDSIVQEIWPADDLSIRAGFFYELIELYNAKLNPGDNVIWYPMDKTDKAFTVEILDIAVGDSSNMRVHPIHDVSEKDYRWLREEVILTLKIVALADIPNAVAIIEGI